ncbi:peptidyl-prolyl cis-trans isomerase [Acidipila sp. EB88]|uniref:peptidyl-prolyl cis-trans isomerase n=1 Tax=Acidipila sp. EB88 TaxID=2305226 RepID=UPI000F6005DF|nr:peptidyl-prolyl cis-trans isomerase [Acidipila sp. EB88]RRA47346.1 peptidylprolyl isomerase [Acidipila sp. EB88]
MIRFLQKDSRFTKTIFIVIISVACVTMVITLVPGIFQSATETQGTYATVRGGNPFTRIFGASTEVSTVDVQRAAQRMLRQQGWPDAALPFVMQRAGQGLIQQAVMLNEANRLGLQVTDDTVRKFLHSGPVGAALFPNGQYIGDQRYAELIQDHFGMSRDQFEGEIKKELEEARLRDLVTGSVAVSDAQVRSSYLLAATKIKFTYAVLSADDIAKTINPTDAELQSFFSSHAALYASAIPETRKLQYIVFTTDSLPGGAPQVTDAEEQAYYSAHAAEYKVDDQVKVRHILIKVATPADDAAAKTKAQGILDQVRKGGNFADLAKKNSDDPGSKGNGGELGFIKKGVTVPAFEQAAFALQPGQTSDLVKTQFGYHIIQAEEKQTAHTRPFDEVKPQILAALTQQREQAAQQAFATQLANEAKKSGLQATAAAHHLTVQTSDYVAQDAVVPGVADASKLLTAAFATAKGGAPQAASTGDGTAVFQVLDVKAAHAPVFAEYRDHILGDYRTQQTPVLLGQKTTQLADKAHTSNDLAAAAKELGATIKTSDLVGRDGQVPDIGAIATTAPQLFTLNPGQISGPIRGERTGVVAKLDDKQEPAAADVAQHLAQSKEALLDQNRDEVFAVFVTNLYEQYNKDKRIVISKQAQTAPAMPGQQGN